ncbi:MAG: glycoside hydrolase family 76 protein [Chitinophagaceae bacterium]
MDRRKFVKNSGGYIMLLPLVKTLGNRDFNEWLQDNESLKMMCLSAFNRFSAIWDFNDFWKRGNTMDACLNFTDAVRNKWAHDPQIKSIGQRVDAMLEKDYTYFKSIDPATLWADDFGWWGLMGLNARKHLLRSGNEELADKYLHLSTDLCWKQARSHAYDFSDTAKPVPHGWNNGPANNSSKGVKNTVANVLYFLLSVRIYRLLKMDNNEDNGKYLDMACRQWTWFDNWFQLEKYDYLKRTTSGGALVQERPTAFFNGSDYADIEHPIWEKDGFGLVIRVCCWLR